MRKEPLIAIILGSLLGVTVAFGVWRFTRTAQKSQEVKKEQKQEKEKKEHQSLDGLEVFEPLDGDVFQDGSVEISGITSANTEIAIYADGEYLLLKSHKDGSFESEIELSGGTHVIELWSFGQKPNYISIPVVVTTQVEGEGLTSIYGTLTDISEDTLQIKTLEDSIQQVSINEDTSYANIAKETKTIEFSELAIGDYIISIGSMNGNSVLNSQRVLVSTSPEQSQVKAIKGTIIELSSADFLVDVDAEQYSIDATGGVDVSKYNEQGDIMSARLKEASEGEQIIIFGLLDDELKAELIHIFPVPIEEE